MGGYLLLYHATLMEAPRKVLFMAIMGEALSIAGGLLIILYLLLR